MSDRQPSASCVSWNATLAVVVSAAARVFGGTLTSVREDDAHLDIHRTRIRLSSRWELVIPDPVNVFDDYLELAARVEDAENGEVFSCHLDVTVDEVELTASTWPPRRHRPPEQISALIDAVAGELAASVRWR